MTLAERVGANIYATRKAKKLSSTKLAAMVVPKTSYQHIRRLEKGADALNMDWVERIAFALRVDPDILLVGLRERPSETIPQLSEQVATGVAETLAAVALQTPDPDRDIVQVVAQALREMLLSFSKTPEAATDAKLARIATDLVSSRYAPAAN
jgi:transcriptional regulator with XRE-family HTH domain